MTGKKRSGLANDRRAYCYPSCNVAPSSINPCDLLPKNTPYQLCSPWPQFGGLDNTNSRFSPILASQTGKPTLLNVSNNLFQANTSPAIARDGTIYIGFNVIKTIDLPNFPSQGYLVAFNSNGSIKWTYTLINPSPSEVYVYFDYSTPTIGRDGTIYFGTTTSNIGNTVAGPVQSTSVYAINPDGTLKWIKNVVPTGSPGPYPNANNSVSISASLVIGSNNNIYFGCYSNNSINPPAIYQHASLFSISLSGATIWEYSLSSSPANLSSSKIVDSVAIDNINNIYFICQQDSTTLVYLISLDANGTFRYKCDLNNGKTDLMSTNGRPVLSVDNSIVYATSCATNVDNKCYLYSINKENGFTSLTQTFNNIFFLATRFNNSMARDTNNNLYFSFTIANNIEFFKFDAAIYSVKNNSVNWTYTIPSPDVGVLVIIDCTPALGADGTLYFGVAYFNIINISMSAYYMYALNSNGTLKWSKLLSNNSSVFSTSPVINLQGNVIISVLTSDYISNTGSNLYSFN